MLLRIIFFNLIEGRFRLAERFGNTDNTNFDLSDVHLRQKYIRMY